MAILRFVLLFSSAMLVAQAQKTYPLDSLQGIKLHNVKADSVTYKGRKALKVVVAAQAGDPGEDRLAILTASDFQDGVIELEMSGQPGAGAATAARGFVGLAFHVSADLKKFECFYLRPTNGRADDQVRRNHSAQYISFPDFPWQRSRKETPEKYESYVDLVPGEWTNVKIDVRAEKARLFVHGNAQPTLIVNDLKHGAVKGNIALWIGPGTDAHFTALKVTK